MYCSFPIGLDIDYGDLLQLIIFGFLNIRCYINLFTIFCQTDPSNQFESEDLQVLEKYFEQRVSVF